VMTAIGKPALRTKLQRSSHVWTKATPQTRHLLLRPPSERESWLSLHLVFWTNFSEASVGRLYCAIDSAF
jgi:hypothetical protein